MLARPGARPRSRCRSTRAQLDAGVLAHFADAVRPEVRPLKEPGPDAGPAWLYRRISPALATSGGGRQRRFGCRGRGGHLLASFGCSWPGDGFLFQKPLSQMHRSTFLPLQHTATLIFSVDWGLAGWIL